MKYIVMAMVMSLIACNTMQKSSNQSGYESHQFSRGNENQQILYTGWKLTNDSSQIRNEIELSPKGLIKFNADGGFEGEMVKIKLSRQEQRSLKSVVHDSVRVQKNRLQLDEYKAKLTDISKDKKKGGIGFGWFSNLLLFALGIVVVWFLIRRIIK